MIARFKSKLPSESIPRILGLCILVVVALMPFHGLMSVVFGAALDSYDAVRLWKELIIVAACLLVSVDMYHHRDLARSFIASRLHQIILAYVFMHFLSYVVLRPELEAALIGLTINLRFFALFLIGRWFMMRTDAQSFAELVARVFVGSILVAIVFAFVKDELFSEELLRSVGYGKQTLPARYTLDDNDLLVRLTGSTRGPNVLALLVGLFGLVQYDRVITAVRRIALEPSQKVSEQRQLLIALTQLLIAVFVLYFTYSRSGLVAFGAAVALLSFWAISRKWQLRSLYAAMPIAMLITVVIALNIDSSPLLRTIILHDDPTSGGAITSTSKRVEANRIAFDQVRAEPMGRGPGTAGPASFSNESQLRIAENYYLQIAQEIGLIGVALFLAIIVMIVLRLNAQRQDFWPRILLASLIGISIAGLFTHVWADDEVALIWWGLAGLFVRD